MPYPFVYTMQKKKILLGDEAVAQGAIDAGISGSYAYPGTPSTEINEYVRSTEKGKIHCAWSPNEKVAYEEALGHSWAGKRALIAMKHVGLNVAADPFMSSAIAGINGGMVLAVADDPGMHSSQNEQDSRCYADFAKVPCFEPTDQQEAYDFTREAFDLSEKNNIPVMVRLVTRLSHTRTIVAVGAKRKQNSLRPARDNKRWTVLPAYARRMFKEHLAKYDSLQKFSEKRSSLSLRGKRLGVIASGIAYNYLMENAPKDISVLKINFYPLPMKSIEKLAKHVKKLIVIEEGYPFIERQLNRFKIHGKLDGTLPLTGELTPDIVRKAIGMKAHPGRKASSLLKIRPPRLCVGCPHASTYDVINGVKKRFPKLRSFGDIGCYTLGALPPYNAIDTCIDMGASIGMAKGAVDAGVRPVIAVIGDSTFTHSGMTSLLKAAKENTDMTVFILDNDTTAMTGGQETLANDQRLVDIVKGLGVDERHIRVIDPVPTRLKENIAIVQKEIPYKGLSVIIPVRACVTMVKKR